MVLDSVDLWLSERISQMLVLSRKKDETVMVGNNIKVTVVAIKGNLVQLGFEAPNDVRVDRKEVRDRIEKEV